MDRAAVPLTMLATVVGLAAEVSLVVVWGRAMLSTFFGAAFILRLSASDGALPRHASTEDDTLAVVVPAYNEQRMLRRTLAGLLDAMPPRAQLTVIDDGSTDDTAGIAAAVLAPPDRNLIRLARNCGKARALNAGLHGSQSRFVLTVDADTILDRASIAAAVRAMDRTGADAVSFWITVDPVGAGMLARLQALEYASTMNFERAAQSAIGCISVMPGAATLYRASALGEAPFSSRTATEDADLALRLARQGRHLTLCSTALALTAAPSTLLGLLRQRRRWALGHLQCCILHFLERRGNRRFTCFTLPNFIIATLSPIVTLVASVLLVCGGETPLLQLTLVSAFLISVIVVYLQRMIAFMLLRRQVTEIFYAIAEPVFSSYIQALACLMAMANLAKFRWVGGPHWQRVVWHK